MSTTASLNPDKSNQIPIVIDTYVKWPLFCAPPPPQGGRFRQVRLNLIDRGSGDREEEEIEKEIESLK